MSKTFREDLAGSVFGKWKVLEFVPNDKKYSYWKIECIDCKKQDVRRSDSFKDLKRQNTCSDCDKIVDLSGKQFDYLTVVKNSGQKDKCNQILWLCKCKCGNERLCVGNSLKVGRTTSCGCKRIKDLRNQRFGRLLVIEPTIQRTNNRNVIWKCLCDCSNEHYVDSSSLLKGHSQSCGCIKSLGEQKIKEILNINNISFVTEFTFNDLISDKGGYLRFDFAVYDNKDLYYLIEYDGIQHTIIEPCGFYTKEKLEELKIRDLIKNKYCLKNNIPLIRIPHTEFNKLTIESLKLETTQFILKG